MRQTSRSELGYWFQFPVEGARELYAATIPQSGREPLEIGP
jgi:hypothetical protein